MSLQRTGWAFLLILILLSGCTGKHKDDLTDITNEEGLISTELFLKQDTVIHFWKMREIPGRSTLVIQEGLLGMAASSFEILETDSAKRVKKALELFAGIREKGYKTYGPDAYSHIIIQADTLYWGAVSDLDKLALVEDMINSALTSGGNGKCTGSDIGSKVSFFAVVFDAPTATKTILKALIDNGIDLPVVIAIEKGNDVKVIWPENFQGEFSLI